MISSLQSGASRFLFFLGALFLGGCEVSVEAEPPLRPLLYTENPDVSPEVAAVRESRLLRELESGGASGRWGQMQAAVEEPPDLATPEDLGRVLTNAVLARDRALWEELFIKPEEYNAMVHMPVERAKTYVDDLIAQSERFWQSFTPPSPTDARPNGWSEVFEFDSILVGDPRSVDGKVAKAPEDVAQYWNVLLKLKFKPRDALVDVRIPKLLVVQTEGGQIHRLASAPESDLLMRAIFETGLHLRPELLSSSEYPLPLKVGTFWRYRRTKEGLPDLNVIDEVVTVDHLSGVHLVHLRQTVETPEPTILERFWVLTPLRVFECDSICRRNIEDTTWLLRHFSSATPVFKFPFGADTWAQGAVKVEAFGQIDVPAGVFPQSFAIWRHASCPVTEYVVWRKGVVVREISCADGVTKDALVEYRIPPG